MKLLTPLRASDELDKRGLNIGIYGSQRTISTVS